MAKGLYYIYSHVHPETKEILYIGHGKHERAWGFTVYSKRQTDHEDCLLELYNKGYFPPDWVIINAHGIKDKREAWNLEKKAILEHKPKFNRHKGLGSMRVRGPVVQEAIKLRSLGLSYEKIRKELNLSSATTAWRYINE